MFNIPKELYGETYGYIPCVKFDASSNGKKPAIKNWMKEPLSVQRIQTYDPNKYNIALRIPENIVVLDVDLIYPEAKESLEKLTGVLGEIPNTLTVTSGRGGTHIYFKTTADVAKELGDSKEYPHIELKTHYQGGVIVIPPSEIPKEINMVGQPYAITNEANIQPLPTQLLEIFKCKKIKKALPTTHGSTTPFIEDLNKLEAVNFRGHEEWTRLLMAYHFVTFGLGCEEFVGWCLQDEKYSNDALKIKARWNSLSLNTEGGITHKTFLNILKEQGCEKNIINFKVSYTQMVGYGAERDLYFEFKHKNLIDSVIATQSIGDTTLRPASELGRYAVSFLSYQKAIKRPIITDSDGYTHQYNGEIWERIDTAILRILVTMTESEGLFEGQKKPLSFNKQNNLIQLIKDYAKQKINFYDLPKDPQFNCKNSFIAIENNKIIEQAHKPEHLQTNCLDIVYDPEAKAPLFEKYMNDTFKGKSEEYIHHILELMGYVIQYNKKIPLFLMLYGEGSTGKSSFIRVLRMFLDEQTQITNVDFSGSHNDRFLTGELPNKLLAIDDDLKDSAVLNDGLLKKLSYRETLTADPKYGKKFNFVNVATPIIACNNYPSVKDVSTGLQRRIKIIDFDNVISEIEANENLIEELKKEKAGILNILIKHYMNFVRRGYFLKPKESVKSLHNWLKNANSSTGFIDEALIKAEGKKVTTKDLNNAYKKYCEETSMKPLGRNRLIQKLKQQKLTIKRGTGNNLYLFDYKIHPDYSGNEHIDIGNEGEIY